MWEPHALHLVGEASLCLGPLLELGVWVPVSPEMPVGLR